MFLRPRRLSHPRPAPRLLRLADAVHHRPRPDRALGPAASRRPTSSPRPAWSTTCSTSRSTPGREALERLLAAGHRGRPGRRVRRRTGCCFFTATRGTPEDEDEWWPCELDCHPETMDEHPGLRWHCRGSYVLVPPARLPGDLDVHWVRGPEHPLPDPLTLLEIAHRRLRPLRGRAERADHDAAAWPSRPLTARPARRLTARPGGRPRALRGSLALAPPSSPSSRLRNSHLPGPAASFAGIEHHLVGDPNSRVRDCFDLARHQRLDVRVVTVGPHVPSRRSAARSGAW